MEWKSTQEGKVLNMNINNIDEFQHRGWMHKGEKEFYHAKWKELLSKVEFWIIPLSQPSRTSQNCRDGEQLEGSLCSRVENFTKRHPGGVSLK